MYYNPNTCAKAIQGSLQLSARTGAQKISWPTKSRNLLSCLLLESKVAANPRRLLKTSERVWIWFIYSLSFCGLVSFTSLRNNISVSISRWLPANLAKAYSVSENSIADEGCCFSILLNRITEQHLILLYQATQTFHKKINLNLPTEWPEMLLRMLFGLTQHGCHNNRNDQK